SQRLTLSQAGTDNGPFVKTNRRKKVGHQRRIRLMVRAVDGGVTHHCSTAADFLPFQSVAMTVRACDAGVVDELSTIDRTAVLDYETLFIATIPERSREGYDSWHRFVHPSVLYPLQDRRAC